ncbi:hypothetical protein AAVH_16902, partial [Aphelenchoides avenae]
VDHSRTTSTILPNESLLGVFRCVDYDTLRAAAPLCPRFCSLITSNLDNLSDRIGFSLFIEFRDSTFSLRLYNKNDKTVLSTKTATMDKLQAALEKVRKLIKWKSIWHLNLDMAKSSVSHDLLRGLPALHGVRFLMLDASMKMSKEQLELHVDPFRCLGALHIEGLQLAPDFDWPSFMRSGVACRVRQLFAPSDIQLAEDGEEEILRFLTARKGEMFSTDASLSRTFVERLLQVLEEHPGSCSVISPRQRLLDMLPSAENPVAQLATFVQSKFKQGFRYASPSGKVSVFLDRHDCVVTNDAEFVLRSWYS